MKIRTIPYSINKARKAREVENELEKRSETLDEKLNANEDPENMKPQLLKNTNT